MSEDPLLRDDSPPRDDPSPRGELPLHGDPRKQQDAPRASGAPVHRPLAARQYLWVVGAAVVLLAALHWLGPILTPFLIGAILAYLGSPAVARAEAHGIPRSLTTLAVILFIAVLVAALFLVLVPLVQAEVSTATARLPDLFSQFADSMAPWLQDKLGITLSLDFASLKTFITENAQEAKNLSLTLLSGVKTGSAILLSVVLNLALIPVVMFYLLRDWNMIIDRLDDLVPHRWRARLRAILGEVDGVLGEFLHGQLLVMVALAAYYAIGLTIAGLSRGLAIGILTGLLVFIPYVGFGLGLILGVLAAVLEWHGWPGFVAVLAVYGIGQLLESYVLVPFLVGDRIGLHPLAVIFALLAFGQAFGFVGVLMALPVSAMLLVALRHLRAAYAASPVYRED
ncbi:MAG TPA: AI-2E family transporter [Casimicrobiaceae bacterium]